MRHPPQDVKAFPLRRPQVEALGFLGHESFEQLAEQFVFAKELVHGGALLVPQHAQFPRLVDHGRVGGDFFVGRRPQIRRDFRNQHGNVIEELVRREYVVFVDDEHAGEPLEPACRERLPLGQDAVGQQNGVIVRADCFHC